MIRHRFPIIALALAAGATPQLAYASCNGTACNSFSATAAWSSSDKRINAVLSNKDTAKEMKVKLCITVEGRCNAFDVTLPPRGSVTKSVSVNGGAAPPKFAVDVDKADFSGGLAAAPAPSSSASASAAASGPTTSADVPGFGKFSYLASADSVVGPPLKKMVTNIATAEQLERQLTEQGDKIAEITRKLETAKDIEQDVTANNTKAKASTLTARMADNSFDLVITILNYMQDEAKTASVSIVVANNDLTEAQDRKRADQLMAEAAELRAGLSTYINAISSAVDLAKKVASGPEGAGKAAFDAVDKVVGMIRAAPLEEEAKKLYAEADALHADSLKKRLQVAVDHLKTIKQTIGRLQPTVQQAMANHDEAWRQAKSTYDGSTKGRFQWKNLDAAIPEAQAGYELAKKATEAAYLAGEGAKALERTGTGSNWTTPGDNARVIQAVADRAKAIFDRAVKRRMTLQNLLAKLEEVNAKAKQAL